MDVILKGSMASENVAVGSTVRLISVAAFKGVFELTVGAVMSGVGVGVGFEPDPVADSVTNVQTYSLARALPARSSKPVVRVPIYSVLVLRESKGLKVAVLSTYVTAPKTGLPLSLRLSLKVLVEAVKGSIASLKVAVIVKESPDFTMPSASE